MFKIITKLLNLYQSPFQQHFFKKHLDTSFQCYVPIFVYIQGLDIDYFRRQWQTRIDPLKFIWIISLVTTSNSFLFFNSYKLKNYGKKWFVMLNKLCLSSIVKTNMNTTCFL